MKFKYSNSSQAFELKNLKFGTFMSTFSKTFLQQTITTTIIDIKKWLKQQVLKGFEGKIASHGYHVYNNTSWVNAKEEDDTLRSKQINQS